MQVHLASSFFFFFGGVGAFGHKIQEDSINCPNFTCRIKSHLLFAGIIKSSLYSPRFQDKG